MLARTMRQVARGVLCANLMRPMPECNAVAHGRPESHHSKGSARQKHNRKPLLGWTRSRFTTFLGESCHSRREWKRLQTYYNFPPRKYIQEQALTFSRQHWTFAGFSGSVFQGPPGSGFHLQALHDGSSPGTISRHPRQDMISLLREDVWLWVKTLYPWRTSTWVANGCSSAPKWSHRLCPMPIWVLLGLCPPSAHIPWSRSSA